ncbi:MAG: LPS-assembly protein LptD [Pseudomonadales bacterium]|nr:LPS-assembly protein LptD [Pseudomonadales bacterium]
MASPSAAEIDWHNASQLRAKDAEEVSWYCEGRYIEPPVTGDPASQEINAEANSALYLLDHSASFEGDVALTRGVTTIHSPFITIDDASEIATIEGPLRIREPGLLVTGEAATANLFEGTGVVDAATFLIHSASMRGSAATLHQKPEQVIGIEDGSITRCEPGNNTWAFRGQNIELLTAEGYGIARHVTLEIKDVPVLYMPWFRFPINDERQSGFLMPGIGSDGSGGTDIVIPYYFNLAPNYDLTYEFRSLWRRGIIHDAQFRHLSRTTNNEVNLGYIRKDDLYDDREIIDQTSAGTDTSAVNVPEFEKQNRWYLNIRHEGTLAPRLTSKVDFSTVSDIDYLSDIGATVSSSAVESFIDPISTSLANVRTAALDRKGSLTYTQEDWNVELALMAFQQLDEQGAAQYESLPSLTYNYRRELSGFDFKLKSNYTYFDKDNSDETGPLAIIGERLHNELTVSLPMREIWGYLEPGAEIIHRKYQLDDTPAGTRQNPDIIVPRAFLKGGLFFDRYFAFSGQDMLQTLEPRFSYLYAEEKFQDDLPQFDAGAAVPSFSQIFRRNRFSGADRIGDANQLTLGVTSRLLQKATGTELASLSLGQIQYFRDREVLFTPTVGELNDSERSPLFLEGTLRPIKELSIRGSLEWEPELDRSNRGKFSLKYSDGERRIVNIDYTYSNKDIEAKSFEGQEETMLSFIWPLKGRWSSIGFWDFGWDENRTIESFIGVEYNDCCWKSRLVLRRFLKEPRDITTLVDDPLSATGFKSVTENITPSDTGIFFEFQFKGFATIGRRLDSLLEDSIPGYRAREDKVGL